MGEKRQFLGFDLSTQQLKATVIDDDFEILHEAFVPFDISLPEYRTHGGVRKGDDGVTVTAPPIMWVKAIDMIMEKLRVAGADFSKITAIAGCAQQHGSVYWIRGAQEVLKSLDSKYFLHEQLNGCFSVRESPVWLDASTQKWSTEMENKVGGKQKLLEITGCEAFLRMTAHHIAKLHDTKPEVYENTERISLVSSFACSVFLGSYAAIDFSDGSGMNLLDISTKNWSEICLNACAPNLEEKLGKPVEASAILGNISSYFQERYGFQQDCKIVAFTGDNPASMAGLGLNPGDLAISLGTSDVLMTWTKEANSQVGKVVFVNAVDSNTYVGFTVWKNGSLMREKIRDSMADGDWSIFSQLLDNTPRGNFGNLGMYFDILEIMPTVQGHYKFNKFDQRVSSFASNEVEARALIEGQFIARKLNAQRFGFHLGQESKIIVTGGASKNAAILQVISDVFNAPIHVQDISDSACLGSCYRAKHAVDGGKYEDMIKSSNKLKAHLAATPNWDAAKIYGQMAERYEKLEKVVIDSYSQSLKI